jgi:ribonuclease HI
MVSTETNKPKTKTALEVGDGGLQSEIGNYEYFVISDGSGHPKQKVGGCSALIIDQELNVHPLVIAHSHTTVTRMEFTGLLESLALIQNMPDFYPGCRVLWFCDHQSMVEMVNDRMKATANEDLWVLFDYYCMKLNVVAKHLPRDNKNLWHNLADLHASTAREVLLDYLCSHTNFPVKYEQEA